MAMWYWMEGGQRCGPVSSQDLKAMAAAGGITEKTMIAKDGAEGWVVAAKVKGLFDRQRQPSDYPSASGNAGGRAAAHKAFGVARDHAAALLGDLRSLNWKEEIVPVDASNIRLLTRDYVFWSVLLLGVVPLLIATIQDVNFQLNAYLFFFAAMWGVVFRDFIVRAPVSWKWLIAFAAFTGLVGIWALLRVQAQLPNSYMTLLGSRNILVNLLGSILVTGVTEEFCKAIPVIAYLVWRREQAQPLTAILLGVFSGLGFAAVENLQYTGDSLLRPLQGLRDGPSGYFAGAQSMITQALTRSFWCVFGHAVWSGIAAYFFVIAYLTKRPVLAVV